MLGVSLRDWIRNKDLHDETYVRDVVEHMITLKKHWGGYGLSSKYERNVRYQCYWNEDWKLTNSRRRPPIR